MYFRHKQKRNSVFERFNFLNKEIFQGYLNQDKEELEIELQKHSEFLAVLTALKTLPEKYQGVISLRYFEGKTNAEIAEILGLKAGTLKSLLSRGLEILRKKCNSF